MARNTTCPECSGNMQAGFIVETAGSGGTPYDANYWQEGTLEKNIWGLKTKGRKQYYIAAYRCERCGFLKFYAGPDLTSDK